jgi:Domain of unknown function (DUF4436)
VLEMDRRAPRRRIMRLLAVGIAVLMLTAAYLLALSRFHVLEVPRERNFAAAGDGAEPAGEVYLEPLSIDALNDAMLIRAYLMPVSSASKDTYAGPGKDLTAFIIHDKTVEEVKLTAADHVATSTFEVNLNEGSVSHYPLDSYAAELAVDLMDAKSSLKVPVQVTVWEGVLGYRLHTTAEAGADPHTAGISIAIRRSGAFALFALCAYGAMVLLGLSALAIGILVFAEVRQVDATLIGALAAVAFALPALRSALPGSPPLGVQADVWVFLWAELAVVLALGLVVFQWARAGPHP